MELERSFSTHEVAELFGINVSTVKRWADSGDLPCMRTNGGHRRFRLRDVVEFARSHELEPAGLRPMVEGLGDEAAGVGAEAPILNGNWVALREIVQRYALQGDGTRLEDLFGAVLVSGWHPAELCDHVIAPTMEYIGKQWAQNRLTVADEHLATHAITTALGRLPHMQEKSGRSPHRALCGTFAPDLHELACSCVALVLRFEGWDVTVLGAATPSDSFVNCVERLRPDLVCVSATVIYDPVAFRTDCERLSLASLAVGNKYVIGGTALAEANLVCPHGVARILKDMRGLVEYVRSEFPRNAARKTDGEEGDQSGSAVEKNDSDV